MEQDIVNRQSALKTTDIQTLALYKSFTYLLTPLGGNVILYTLLRYQKVIDRSFDPPDKNFVKRSCLSFLKILSLLEGDNSLLTFAHLGHTSLGNDAQKSKGRPSGGNVMGELPHLVQLGLPISVKSRNMQYCEHRNNCICMIGL